MTKQYYLGPWRFVTEDGMSYFAPPEGARGTIDFATIPEQSVGGSDRRIGFFALEGLITDAAYTHLGSGDLREMPSTQKMRDAFQSELGYLPSGDKLIDLVWDCLTSGSDPEGDERWKPLMPGTNRWLDLHLGGHSRIKSEPFEFGRHPHSNRVRDVLQRQFRQEMERASNGKSKDKEHHRRILDYWCEKYRCEDWQQFVPADLRRHVPGRLKHATTITESFDTADSDTLGPDLSWSELAGDFDIVGNRARSGAASGTHLAQATSDLSSSDHYAQFAVYPVASSLDCAPAARCQSGPTAYIAIVRDVDLSNDARLFKLLTGTFTQLGTTVSHSSSDGDVVQCKADGSSITHIVNGSTVIGPVSDTGISSGLRCGIWAFEAGRGDIDNFEAADLAAPPAGIKYTQLERGVRGFMRGVYSGSM